MWCWWVAPLVSPRCARSQRATVVPVRTGRCSGAGVAGISQGENENEQTCYHMQPAATCNSPETRRNKSLFRNLDLEYPIVQSNFRSIRCTCSAMGFSSAPWIHGTELELTNFTAMVFAWHFFFTYNENHLHVTMLTLSHHRSIVSCISMFFPQQHHHVDQLAKGSL